MHKQYKSRENLQDLTLLICFLSLHSSKEEILHHEEQYEAFYVSLCVLAADYLASNSHQCTYHFLYVT